MILFDLHNDLPTSGRDIAAETEAYARAGVTAVLAVWTTELGRIPDLPRVDGFRYAVEDMGYFTFSGRDVAALDALCPVYCGLTWNDDNPMGGGAFGRGGLTALGRRTVGFLNGRGIAVDGAHLCPESFDEAAELADRFLVSHAFVRELCDHPRNVTLDGIGRVVKKGGIVGLTPICKFTGGGIAEYVKGIELVLDRFGDDVPAIGTDFNGSTDFPRGLDDYAAVCALKDRLLGAGHTERTVDKIFYDNAARFFAAGGNI